MRAAGPGSSTYRAGATGRANADAVVSMTMLVIAILLTLIASLRRAMMGDVVKKGGRDR
jgi:hypothetical protein